MTHADRDCAVSGARSAAFGRDLLLGGFVALGIAGGAAAQAPASVPTSVAAAPEAREARIPVEDAGTSGGDFEMLVKLYIPEGAGPFPVVLYSHGRAGDEPGRRALKEPVPLGHVRYWQRKGFAVVAPVRPGYGETGGADRESSGASYDRFGNCRSQPDFETPAKNAAAATSAALDWVRQQPWASRDRILLVGTSMGGLTSVATAAASPPGVIGYVNFSGGAGGDPLRSPGKTCGAEQMENAMAQFGRTTTVPNLWLYAENDRYWGAEAPRQWHAAFAAGGSPSTFVQTAPLPDHDGHQLLLRGGRLWGVHVDAFIRALGF